MVRLALMRVFRGRVLLYVSFPFAHTWPSDKGLLESYVVSVLVNWLGFSPLVRAEGPAFVPDR